MKIEICNRWSGSIQYECDLDVAFDIDAPYFRLGQVWAILFDDKSRWVRMGCLFHSLDEWEKIGIRKSNLTEFPDDGSVKCEERVAAFEFAKAAALRMKAGTK
jgi:hypothetical protein